MNTRGVVLAVIVEFPSPLLSLSTVPECLGWILTIMHDQCRNQWKQEVLGIVRIPNTQ